MSAQDPQGPKKDRSAPEVPDAVLPCPRKRRRKRRVWLSLRAVVMVVAMPLVFAAVAAVSLIGREVTAPSWIVRDVEARAAQVLAGGSLGFRSLKITVGRDLHPRLVVQGAVLRDAENAVLARVPRIEALVSPRGVLQGRMLAQEIMLDGAQIALLRQADGSVALAFDQDAVTVGAADSFVELLDQVDGLFGQGALEALEQVTATGLIINYSDVRAGRSWVFDDGCMAIDLRDQQTDLRAQVALLSGRDFVTTAEMSYVSPRGSRAAELGLNISDAAAADIATQSPLLSWLSVLDAPISGALRGQLDGQGQLQTVNATLQIGAGELRPTAATRPVPFQSARTYFSFDPAREKLTFDLVEIDSAWGRVTGTAQTYLREFEGGWPAALLGQMQLGRVVVSPEGIYAAPLVFREAQADFRLRLDPFTLEIGQVVVVDDAATMHASGQVQATTGGWSVALDLRTDAIATDAVLGLWPAGFVPRTRAWLAGNVDGGFVHNVRIALRLRPDQRPLTALTLEFSEAGLRYLGSLPPLSGARGSLSLIDRRLAVVLDAGRVVAPEGGPINLAGSSMVIPQTGRGARGQFDLRLASSITAAMSMLNAPPFNVLRASDLPVSFAQGRAAVTVALETPFGRDIAPEDRIWSATARLRDVRSDALIPGRVLTASGLDLRADAASLVVAGPVQLGNAGGTVRFSRALGAGSAGTAGLEAEVALGQAFLDAFNIRLPAGMVTGRGQGQLAVDLSDMAAPSFRLTSDLRGLGLQLAGLGWAKAPAAAGALTVEGRLGAEPRIDRLAISAPGLETTGTVRLAAGGGLERAAFARVRLGGWLDAPVVLVGRGQGRPAAIRIAGGWLDLRAANFGGGNGDGGGGGSGSGGQAGPLDIALDRLQITEGIRLDGFRGRFQSDGGLTGDFTGRVNGGATVQGTLVPVQGRSAVRIRSGDAGGVMRSAGLLPNAYGGDMDLTLLPAGAEGSYDGTLTAREVSVRDAPALAQLLDAVSVVGLLNQMGGQGVLFNEVDARFRISPSQIIVTRSSAIGPGLGLSLDGIYAQASKTMDFQGVVSPFYLLNGIGAVLTRPGEGLVGFNFNLRGPVDNPQVSVNPLSALTPGMFRDIFRRPPPVVSQ